MPANARSARAVLCRSCKRGIRSAESCAEAGKQKKRGGDSLSRKRATAARVRAPAERHVWSAHENSDTTRLFGQMAEEGVRTVLRDFGEKVQSRWHLYKRQQPEKGPLASEPAWLHLPLCLTNVSPVYFWKALVPGAASLVRVLVSNF